MNIPELDAAAKGDPAALRRALTSLQEYLTALELALGIDPQFKPSTKSGRKSWQTVAAPPLARVTAEPAPGGYFVRIGLSIDLRGPVIHELKSSLTLPFLSSTSVVTESLNPSTAIYIPGTQPRYFQVRSRYYTSDFNAPQTTELITPNPTGTMLNLKYDFGAVGDGSTNDTAAFEAAVASNRKVFIPAGDYICDPLVFTGISSFMFEGDGYGTNILLTTPGDLWTWDASGRILIKDMAFTQVGSLVTSNGQKVINGSGVIHYDTCQFSLFSQNGVRLDGSGGALSGIIIEDCLFLQNGQEQLYSKSSNDYHMIDNQFGTLGFGNPTVGSYFESSNAGTYIGNYHWGNVVGHKEVSCLYNVLTDNRMEESQHEGVVLNGCFILIFIANRVHTNGEAAVNAYDAMSLSGTQLCIITGNQFFDFSGGTFAYRYGINEGAGCANNTIKDNDYSGFGTGPYFTAVGFGNLRTDHHDSGSSGGTVALGVVTHMGHGNQSTNYKDVVFLAPFRCIVARLEVHSADAPGVGQSFTYRLYQNGGASSVVAVIANTALAEVDAGHYFVLEQGDRLTVAIDPSAGAAVTQHSFAVAFMAFSGP